MTHEERMEIFQKIDIGCVTDALIHYGVGGWTKGLFPVCSTARIYGRAVTARFDIVTPPRTEVTPLEVIELCQPGDVLVWNADLETNLMGGNIFTFAKRQGVSGIVLEGHHRDSDEIAALGVEKREVVVSYQVGDTVKITDGALESFLGTVEEIDLDRSKVRVVVSMFGRETPVELELDQVELVQD